jgi:hypothetical protein
VLKRLLKKVLSSYQIPVYEGEAYRGIVEQYYEMNPETETLLFDGDALQDGMTVLIDSGYRQDLDEIESHYDYHKARINNRWCTVSNLIQKGDLLTFIGTYEDGVMEKRTFNSSIAWLVKLNTIPESKDENDVPAGGTRLAYLTEFVKNRSI